MSHHANCENKLLDQLIKNTIHSNIKARTESKALASITGVTIDATAQAAKAALLAQLQAQATQLGLTLSNAESADPKEPTEKKQTSKEIYEEIENQIEDALHRALDNIYDFDSQHSKGTAQGILDTFTGEPFYSSRDWQEIQKETLKELFNNSILPEGYDENNIEKQYIIDVATAEMERFIAEPDVLTQMGMDKETEEESMETEKMKDTTGEADEEDDDESEDDEPTIEGYLTARQIVEEGEEEKSIER